MTVSEEQWALAGGIPLTSKEFRAPGGSQSELGAVVPILGNGGGEVIYVR